jgi:hypothetical protein
MGFFIDNLDQKQRVSVSKQTFDILKFDIIHMAFSKHGQKENLGGFLNHIISNMYDHHIMSEFPLAQQLETVVEEYLYELEQNKKISSEIKKSMLKKLSRIITPQMQLSRLNTISSEEQVKINFRIDNQNISILKSIEESEYFDGRLSRYLNYILETYSAQSLPTREGIINRKNVEKLLYAIKNNASLSVELKTGAQFVLEPYKTYIDQMTQQTMIVGIQRSKFVAGTIQINLSQIKFMQSSKPKTFIKYPHYLETIEKEEKKKLNEEFIIKLNVFGEKQIYQQLHRRPRFEKHEEYTYKVTCTEDEFLYYFLKFGPNVTVVEPEDMKKLFIRIYQKALNNYKQ